MSFRSRYFIFTAWLLVLPQFCLSQQPAAPVVIEREAEALRQTLADLEAMGDTWHPQIAETMTSLARLMQQVGDHDEALVLLERAVHISRVNNGLFSLQQVPALEMQIASHMALEQWTEADGLQQYSFFIHNRSMQTNDPELIPALVTYAEWHVQWYTERPSDVTPVTRLIDAYQLYSVALSLADTQPEPAAWPRERYLQRMAYLAWQLSLVMPQMRTDVMYGVARKVDEAWVDRMTQGQSSLRANTFVMGEAALKRIAAQREAHLLDAPPNSSVHRELLKQHVESVLQLGDWNLLFTRRYAASEIYREAWDMLADADEALRKEVFGQVVTIPVFDEYLQPTLVQIAADGAATLANSLVATSVAPVVYAQEEQEQWPWADMRFDLTRFGRVNNVELVNSSSEISENVKRLVITSLRDTPMRPLITASGPAGSDSLLYRFPYDPKSITNRFADNVSNEVNEQVTTTDPAMPAIESAAFQAQ